MQNGPAARFEPGPFRSLGLEAPSCGDSSCRQAPIRKARSPCCPGGHAADHGPALRRGPHRPVRHRGRDGDAGSGGADGERPAGSSRGARQPRAGVARVGTLQTAIAGWRRSFVRLIRGERRRAHDVDGGSFCQLSTDPCTAGRQPGHPAVPRRYVEDRYPGVSRWIRQPSFSGPASTVSKPNWSSRP